jgi:hypothetical protein
VPQENGAQNEKHYVQPQLNNHYEEVYVQEMSNAGADESNPVGTREYLTPK